MISRITKSPAATGHGVQAGLDSEKDSGKLPSRTTWLPVPVRNVKSKLGMAAEVRGGVCTLDATRD